MISNKSIIINGETGIKYDNKYYIYDTYAEMHITDNDNSDIVIIIDIDDIKSMRKHFWQCTYSGKPGYKRPQVFCYIHNNTKMYLNRFLLNQTEKCRIIFINRNPYDYRKCNLHISKGHCTEYRDRNKHNRLGMNNIRELKRNNILVAFQVTYIEDMKPHFKSFNVRKFGGINNALSAAKRFRDSKVQLV